jgi:hypothetical protein
VTRIAINEFGGNGRVLLDRDSDFERTVSLRPVQPQL